MAKTKNKRKPETDDGNLLTQVLKTFGAVVHAQSRSQGIWDADYAGDAAIACLHASLSAAYINDKLRAETLALAVVEIFDLAEYWGLQLADEIVKCVKTRGEEKP